MNFIMIEINDILFVHKEYKINIKITVKLSTIRSKTACAGIC